MRIAVLLQIGAVFFAKRAPLFYRRAVSDSIQPACKMGLVRQVLFLTFPQRGPWPDCHIRNGIEAARHIIVFGQLPVQHPIQARHFIAVAVLGIGQILCRFQRGRIFQEMVGLPGHWPHPPHLPHQPLVHGHAVAFSVTIKLAGFARQILQNRTRFKNRDGRSIRPVWVNNCRHAVIGRDFQEIGLELVACANIHEMDIIGQAHFF